jgi:hypothetical protein
MYPQTQCHIHTCPKGARLTAGPGGKLESRLSDLEHRQLMLNLRFIPTLNPTTILFVWLRRRKVSCGREETPLSGELIALHFGDLITLHPSMNFYFIFVAT